MVSAIVGARKAAYTVPDDLVTAAVDVTPWRDRKIAPILAHRSEVRRGALPGLVASLSPADRATLLSTEWYVASGLDGLSFADAAGQLETS